MNQINEQTADYQLADLSPVLKASDAGNMLLESLPVWLSAQTRKSAGRGRSANNTLQYGVQKLRELILELAVRGKLVPQDLNDEPASILLGKIAEEKVRLVKEGKIKKQKLITDSNSSTLNDQLPKNWTKEFLGNFAYLEMGQSPASKYYNQSGEGMPFFQGKADFNDTYPTVRYWCVEPSKKSYPGDVLLSVRAPVGPTNIANIECCIGRGIAALRPLGSTPTNFLRILIKASEHELKARATGTTFSAVSKSDIEAISVPVPPLAEQHRIVKKVDELMALCDQLEQQQAYTVQAHDTLVKVLLDTLTHSENAEDFQQNWRRIAEHFDSLFTTESSIDQLKQTLLQLAVMGKLVPQDPNEESANVLLEKIAEEKSRLFKEGKIKIPKPVLEVTSGEQLFQVPTSWVWCRLDNLAHHSEAGWSPNCEDGQRTGEEWGVLKVSAVSWGEFKSDENKTLPKHMEPRIECEVHPGDFLISRANTAELVARSVVVPKSVPKHLMMSDKIVRVVFSEMSNAYYINLYNGSEFARNYYSRIAGGTSSSMKNVSRKQIQELCIPLPPLAEQHRIVKKVDELMALCDQLKDRLNQTQTLQQQLADALVVQFIK